MNRRLICASLLTALLCSCAAPAGETPAPSAPAESVAAESAAPAETAPAAETAPEAAAAPSPAGETGELTAAAVAQAILAGQDDGADYAELSPEDVRFYIEELYGLTDWTDGAVCTTGGVDAREIAVVRAEDAASAAQAMEDYRQSRAGDFYGYEPEQAALVENGGVVVLGEWAALLLCSDPDAAQAAFEDVMEGAGEAIPVMENYEPDLDDNGYIRFDPPNAYDMTPYDTIAIVLAWESGERDWLGEKDAAILARCEEILAECITEDMTDFEKELAIHDWLIDHVSYDQSVYHNETPLGRPDNLNPYGALVNGYAICLGYAVTFQLLMELCEVECITVPGAAYSSSEDHGWNMVKLDGEWYCVDVTWDDPTSSAPVDSATRHRYFNVTSGQMRNSDHQWDYENTPEAAATRYRWNGAGEKPQ